MNATIALLAPCLCAVGLALFMIPQEAPSRRGVIPEPTQPEPFSYCFAPGTDMEVVAKYSARQAGGPLGTAAGTLNPDDPQFALQVLDRWFRTATNGTSQSNQGDPLTLTWHVVSNNTFIPAAGNIATQVSSNSDLRTRLAELYGGSATEPAEDQPWFSLFEEVFQNLSLQTGLNFVYEPNDDDSELSSANSGVLGERADIRISGNRLDGDFGVLAFNFFPDFGDMVIDTDDGFLDNTANNSRRLRNMLAHEIGHGLGLAHVCPLDNTKLMEPFINLGFDGVQFDDTYSLQRNYGDALERHNNNLNNDDFANAAPMATASGSTTAFAPLSIDDETDSDFYAIELQVGESIAATVDPSAAAYLEGAQNNDGTCSAGVLFDPAIQHDLSLTLFDPNENMVSSVNLQPAGQAETMSPVVAGMSGTYYLQVSGDTADRAQLYGLSITVDTPPVAFNLVSNILTTELYSGQNGAPDPMESVEYTFTLRNEGTLDAANTVATLSGPAGFIPLETTATIGTLGSNQAVVFPLTFALDGECGETLDLTLTVTADNGDTATLPVNLSLGAVRNSLSENFDASPNLPPNWQSASVGGGSGWSINGLADTPSNAAFAANPRNTGESILTTPVFGPVAPESVLSFRQFYDTQSGRDGGVLEIAIAGGPWLDIVTAGGVFQAGGYNNTILSSFGTNSLDGRSAWSGDSGGYLTTEVILPASAANQTAQLRWRMGTDIFTADNGWLLDTISVEAVVCDPEEVLVSLSSGDTTASEFFLNDDAELTVATALPVASDLAIAVEFSGAATPETDFSLLGELVLSANSDSLTTTIDALEDGISEGVETFTVSSSDGSSSLLYTINDSPFGEWAATFLSSTTEQDLADDPDRDGVRNLEEYLFGTNPLVVSELPHQVLSFADGALTLTLPVESVPADFLITPFSSPDLDVWTDGAFITTEGNEFTLEVPDSSYFIRLGFSLRANDADTAP